MIENSFFIWQPSWNSVLVLPAIHSFCFTRTLPSEFFPFWSGQNSRTFPGIFKVCTAFTKFLVYWKN